MAIDTAYIRSVLERFEGRGKAAGYVPCGASGAPLGVSGVTIATGLDLGQQSRSSLAAMGLPDRIVGRLAPYCGMKGAEAQYALAREPLCLTREEVEIIDAAVHAAYIDETAALFGRAAFAAAPKEAQAVAASLHFQFGTPARKASPALENAWNAMRRGDYAYAAAILREPLGWSPAHQQYLPRRNAEASLLEKAA